MAEINLELLVGCKVQTPSGRNAGCIHEIIAEQLNGEWVITEYQIGPVALLSRLSAFHLAALLFHLIGADKELGYRVPWDTLDLTDPNSPRLRCELDSLEPLTPADMG